MRKPKKYNKVPEARGAKKVFWGIVAVAVVLVVANLVAVLLWNPEAEAQAKFEALAREYYEDYYYPRLSDKAVLSDYSERGLRPITLRVLLSYNDGQNADLEEYFAQFECDTAATTARITPVEPFGKTDYSLKLNYSCNF